MPCTLKLYRVSATLPLREVMVRELESSREDYSISDEKLVHLQLRRQSRQSRHRLWNHVKSWYVSEVRTAISRTEPSTNAEGSTPALELFSVSENLGHKLGGHPVPIRFLQRLQQPGRATVTIELTGNGRMFPLVGNTI